MNSLIDAADNHNIANGDGSWFDAKINATTGMMEDVKDAATYGTVGAVVAGLNSFRNSGVAVYNFLGGEAEYTKTYDLLRELDDDLARYYRKHEEGVELAGFMLGALVPGTAGIKALQAAKAGFIGTNLAKSTGLMRTLTFDYANAAKAEFASKTSPFSILNSNVVGALVKGFGSAAIESTAFEVAVAGTMFKSPVLDGQGASNIAHNIMMGTLIGGGLGGVLYGVSTVYGIKKAGSAIDKELFPYKNIVALGDNASSDLKIINYHQQKLNLPEPQLGEVVAGNSLDDTTRLNLITSERKKTVERLDVLIRQEFNKIAGGDETIGQQLFNKFSEAKNVDDVAAALIHVKGFSRISENERLVVGDVLFPTHGIKREAFDEMLQKGENAKFLTDTATAGTQGYRVIGDVSKIKVAGAGVKSATGYLENKDAAFASGYDLYRNMNGQFSVNPGSTILQSTTARRVPNNLIIDFEQQGVIVSKATPGLNDLASHPPKDTKAITVKGDFVLPRGQDPIKIDQKLGAFSPLNDNYLEVQARYIWAQEQRAIKWKDKIIHENDLPLLERAYYDGDKAEGFIIRLENGKATTGPTGERLKTFIERKKIEFAEKLDKHPLDEMAIRLNVDEKWLSGEKAEIAKIRPGVDYSLPRYARADYPDSLRAMDSYNSASVDGMVQYEIAVKMIKDRHEQTFANYSGELGARFPDAPNWSDPNRTPTRAGSGASLFGFANSNFGSAGGWAQFVGSLTSRLKTEKKTATIKALNDVAASVSTPELRSELDLITNKLRSSPEAWVFHPESSKTLIKRADYKTVLNGGKASETIPITAEVSDFLRTHSSINAERQVHVKNLKGDAGVMDDADLDIIYPPPIDTAKYKHFVFVEPKQFATLGNQKRMIVAKDEATLEKLISQVDQNEFRISTKQDKEEWHKAVGDYDFALGLNESVVDSSLKRSGVLRDHFAGNPSNRILDDYLDWHTRQEELLATRMVQHRYSQAFEELNHLGESYTNLSTSQFRSLTEKLVESVKDPYNDIVKTALDISRASEYKWWRSFNETVKDAIEGPARQLGQVFQQTKAVDDKFVESVNRKSQELGLGTPYKDAYSALVASGNIADKPFVAKYIAKAQSIMSTTLLQLDFFNAVNNTISTPVLLSAETRHLISAIGNKNPEVAGKLSQLLSVSTPEGAQALQLPSTGRLLMNALQNLRRDPAEKLGLLERYQGIGTVTDILQQERSMLGELSQNFGQLTPGKAESAISRAVEFGKKWTGNLLAEQTTRFLASDVMRQITDLAIEAGVLRNTKEADEYIQLFVNKVQGNYLHSQRPIVFQGVVGQAVSLFQTYQFNLMQQLFKYVGEGDKKAVAMLLGLQGSIYGLQGLPAFNFLNTHIVGNASGNVQHKDLYFATNTVFGKQLGDWLLYGAGSNALGLVDSRMKLNIYSRGDINPRQVTVLPTNFEDIPVVNASVRFVRNLYNIAERTGNGAALWPTISQAIEHNGLSRPLAGLGQIAQGYTTTNQGSLLSSSQDFLNIATVSRIAGGKPFDEAVSLDALYRINAYRAADSSRIQDVGSALKTSLIGNRNPTEQEVTDFAVRYAKAGGRIENFNRFMTGQMMQANRSQVNKLAEGLNSPFATQMQLIMGGIPIPDYANSPR